MSATSTDRIEKQVTLQATPARVYRALTDPKEFSEWFGVDVTEEFAAGKHVQGKVTCAGYEHMTFKIWIEKMEPEQLFSYRWQPHAILADVDYPLEETTLVEFRLEAKGNATHLTIIESGFDGLPADGRAAAFMRNEGGWTAQVENITRHVTEG